MVVHNNVTEDRADYLSRFSANKDEIITENKVTDEEDCQEENDTHFVMTLTENVDLKQAQELDNTLSIVSG